MSKLLFDEQPLVIVPSLAKSIGLNESIVLQQIHYWLQPARKPHLIEGVPWIWNSLSDWREQFPFWSESTIYRALQSLEDLKVIQVGNFNKRKGDRTKWFTIDYARLKEVESGGVETPSRQDETPSRQDETPSRQDETTLPETSSETSSEITPIASAVSSSEEFAAVFQTVESAMHGMEPSECEQLRELWEDVPDLEAHHFAYLQTIKYADSFNLAYYRKCLYANRRQNAGTQASPPRSTNGNGRRGARADAPALQTERPLRRAAAPDSSRGPVYDPG